MKKKYSPRQTLFERLAVLFWWKLTNVYLKGTKITDEEFDQIALDPIPEFVTWNYIIPGYKHERDV